jgi:hypothetical protein
MRVFKTIEECRNYLRSNNLKKGVFFENQIRSEHFYTLKPTNFVNYSIITGFQSKVKINVNTKKVNYLNNCSDPYMKKCALILKNDKRKIL